MSKPLPMGLPIDGSCRWRLLLRLEFVKVVERVLQWHASDAAEARLSRELLQLPFWQTHGAQPLPMAGERGGHAIEHTEAIEQAAQRPGIAFQVLGAIRSEEHTSELQSRQYLVCRLLLEKKNNR